MERVRLEFPADGIVHQHALAVRIGDINIAGHLGHDTLVTLLHESRAQAFMVLGLCEWDMAGRPGVVADLAIQYLAETRWGDELMAETAMPPAGGKGQPVYQRLRRPADGRTVALARVGMVWLDPEESSRPVAIPTTLHDALARARPQGVT